MPLEDLADFIFKKGFVSDHHLGSKYILQSLGLKQQEPSAKVVVSISMFQRLFIKNVFKESLMRVL